MFLFIVAIIFKIDLFLCNYLLALDKKKEALTTANRYQKMIMAKMSAATRDKKEIQSEKNAESGRAKKPVCANHTKIGKLQANVLCSKFQNFGVIRLGT